MAFITGLGANSRQKKFKQAALRVGDRLRVGFEVHRRDRGAIRKCLMREPVNIGRAEHEILTENELRWRGLVGGAGFVSGRFDWHRNGTREFGSSVCGRRGIGV